MARGLWILSVMACSGCINLGGGDAQTSAQVNGNPFDAPPVAPTTTTKTAYAPASGDVALRVDQMGRKVLAANPEVGMKPLFATIGVPQPEIFHQDNKVVYVTEGLVKQCRGDAELAAVLCHELGRMVSAREAKISADIRQAAPLPPIQVPMGNGINNSTQDMTRAAEMGKFEQRFPRNRVAPPPPDPNKLACLYLERAGFQPAELDMVRPLLQTAEKNANLEKQFKGTVAPAQWSP